MKIGDKCGCMFDDRIDVNLNPSQVERLQMFIREVWHDYIE